MKRTPHAKRPEARGVVHVTMRRRRELPSMRTPRAYRFLERAFRAGKGKVFADRYFAVVTESVRQAMKVLKYVLNNARKHGIRLPTGTPDPFSSARWFRRWREEHRRPLRSPPVVEAWSWEPWTSISLDEIPGRRAESFTLAELLV